MLNAGSSPTKVAKYIVFNLSIISWRRSLDSSIPCIPVSNQQELKGANKRFIDRDFKYDLKFVEQFDWNVIAEKLESVVEELL